jgi:hypothetical protein
MERILSEVTAAEMRGPLDKLHELLANKKLGHYWLNQLVLMMRKEPTHVFSKKWLEELNEKRIWEDAEKHFKKTRQLWYNKPEWPFQICVLEIGGLDNEKLKKKWLRRYEFFYSEKGLAEEIDNLDLSASSVQEKKILLIRLQTRLLGLPYVTEFCKMNCPHPELNLALCPPETAFYVRPLIKKYPDSEPTIVTMDFCPAPLVISQKTRVFYFKYNRHYFEEIEIGIWDISLNSLRDQTEKYWIFNYTGVTL